MNNGDYQIKLYYTVQTSTLLKYKQIYVVQKQVIFAKIC